MIPIFSVIVPVYNAEKNILNCIWSLQAQLIREFEVILVDDGSVDNSGAICDRTAEVDARFTVIHQQNAGPSSARNRGLAIAKGQFVVFVDSDDTVAIDYLEELYMEFLNSGADVVFMGYIAYSPEGICMSEHIPPNSEKDKFSMILELAQNDMFGYTWIKAFRHEAIGNTQFREDISLFEDEIFTCEVMEHCNVLSCVEKPIYHYTCDNPGALMGRTYQNFCQLQDQVYCAWQSLFRGALDSKLVLESKANAQITICQFYAFERDIEIRSFLESLKKSQFFKNSTLSSEFSIALRKNQYYKVLLMRYIYKLKVRLSKCLHK